MIQRWRLGDEPAESFGDLLVRDLGRALPSLRKHATLSHIRLPARSAHPPVLHRRTRELVLITCGKATGLIGGRRLRLKRGDLLLIPPGTWHQFSTGPEAVEAVCLFFPAMDRRAPDIQVARRPRR